MSDDPYPEHTKLQQVKDQSQAIGEFLEWLQNREPAMVLHEWRNDLTDRVPCEHYSLFGFKDNPADCPKCHGEGVYTVALDGRYIPSRRTTEQLLADFFEIDLVKIEQEKRAMLEHLRAQPDRFNHA